MLSSKANTIQEHQEIVGSRFQLAQIIMQRTKQLMKGSPINLEADSEFYPKRRGEIPNHRLPKVALEELRQGKLHWKRLEAKTPAEIPVIEVNSVVFGE